MKRKSDFLKYQLPLILNFKFFGRFHIFREFSAIYPISAKMQILSISFCVGSNFVSPFLPFQK